MAKLLKAVQLGRDLQVHRSIIYLRIHEGRIPVHKTGIAGGFIHDEIEQWLRRDRKGLKEMLKFSGLKSRKGRVKLAHHFIGGNRKTSQF
jgi:predicted DNA-binding transcriptional regulator AlpA